MHFTGFFLLAAAAAAAAAASVPIAFTTIPSSVQAGNPTVIGWGGGDGSPVTLTLKAGDPLNLQTIAIIVGDAIGTNYTWIPSTVLQNRADYALQITQGLNGINYSGRFPLTGGSMTAPSFSGAAAPPRTSSVANVSAITTTLTLANATMTVTPVFVISDGSSAGIVPMSRNTTFSSAALTGTSTRQTDTMATTSVDVGATTATSGTRTAGATASSSSAAAVLLRGQMTFGMGALAAAIFWL